MDGIETSCVKEDESLDSWITVMEVKRKYGLALVIMIKEVDGSVARK